MKRTFGFLLLAVLLLNAAGCKASAPAFQEPDYTEANIVNGVTHTDYSGVSVQINDLIYRDGKTELSVVWNNNTEQTVTYGETYTIERLEGETWVSCAKTEELAFRTIGYSLEAGRLKNKTYDLTEMFDVSQPGTYRFKTSCTVQTGAEKSEQCQLWAQFTLAGEEPHMHRIATEVQTVDDPYSGYCGNTQTTLTVDGKAYTFLYGNSVTLTDILINLDYQTEKVCDCPAEYTVDTEFDSGYAVNLTKGFARQKNGQADLTQEQIDKIAQIVKWAKTTNGECLQDGE